MTPEKQKEKAKRPWISMLRLPSDSVFLKIKIELEDLSLKYLEPEAYYDLVEKIALKKECKR